MKNKNNLLIVIIIVLILVILFELVYFSKNSNNSVVNDAATSSSYKMGETLGESTWFLTINSTAWEMVNGKSNLVINLTFECTEKHKQCTYGSSILIKNKNNNTIASFIDARFESTISDSTNSAAYGGDTVTGNFYIELEQQEDIYIDYLDYSDKSESPIGKTYTIKIN